MTPPTVLVADDDRSIRTVLTQALGRSGYQVRCTGNAATLVALGRGRGGRPGHHRRGDAGRERAGPDPAHQAHPPGPARGGHERADHADDSGEGGAARRLRVPAEAVRPEGAAGRRRPRAGGAPARVRGAAARAARCGGAPAADRAQRRDAGDLPQHRPPDDDRPDGDGQWRVRHRQGAGGPRPARLRAPPHRAVRRHQHGRHPARADRERAVRARARQPSPARSTAPRAGSSRPPAARCSWTRSATCRRRRRPGCCACCRRGSSPPSAGGSRSAPTSASWPPPTATCARPSAPGSSGRTCSTA